MHYEKIPFALANSNCTHPGRSIWGKLQKPIYRISDKAIEKFREINMPDEMVAELKSMKAKNFSDVASFNKELNERLGESQVNKYRKVIIRQAYDNKAVWYVSWMGDLFLRALKMLIIPLILASHYFRCKQHRISR
jgi:proton glutamate symport protein